ncbi:MAG: hypothetical protein OEP52_00170 [Acidimicrobiia bacterium]|nr:hypothetical protein [Acidimicrobiia bacterium]
MRPPARIVALVLSVATLAMGLAAGIGGWPGGGGVAFLIDFPDCEASGGGLISQPTATWTSLAFVVVGIWIAGDRRLISLPARLLFATALVTVGIGSFLGHAALTDGARRLDSLAIKLMLVAFIAASLGRLWSWQPSAWPAGWASLAVPTIALELTWPATRKPLLAILVVTAAALVWLSTTPETRRWLVQGLALLGAGGAAWWLGRAGGPLCAPWAWFQLHGLWHILAAAGIASVYQLYRSEAT